VYLGGEGAGRHLLGVNHRETRELGISSDVSMGSMSLFEVDRIVAPLEPVSIPKGDVYPPRPYIRARKSESSIALPARDGEFLAIASPFYFWMPYAVEVELDGRPVDPQFSGTGTAFYRCATCPLDGSHNWSVTIRAPDPDLVEVMTFIPPRLAP
jgi:hypothetical protein